MMKNLSINYIPKIFHKHTLIVGKTQSGKTTFILNLLKRIKKTSTRYIFFNSQFDNRFGVLPTCESLEQFKKLLPKYPVINIYPLYTSLEEISYYVFNLKLKNRKLLQNIPFVFIVDELHSYLNPWKIGDELKNVITRGLGLNLSLVGITQRLSLINKTIYTQIFYLIIFEISPFDKTILEQFVPLPENFIKYKPYLYDFNTLYLVN